MDGQLYSTVVVEGGKPNKCRKILVLGIVFYGKACTGSITTPPPPPTLQQQSYSLIAKRVKWTIVEHHQQQQLTIQWTSKTPLKVPLIIIIIIKMIFLYTVSI